jgi:hypothetical protein
LAALYGDLAHLSVAADGRASFSVTVRWPQSNGQCTL